MKNLRKRILLFCLSFAVVFLGEGVQTYAMEIKETYTITFRPGKVGYFSFTSNPEGERSAMAYEVAAYTYGNYRFEVTKNGAIKVEVPKDSVVPAAPLYIQTEAGYFVKEDSSWGPQGILATKNEDYVVDYGKIIDAVEYTVEYIDQYSKESIAPFYISQGNVGEERRITAPPTIVISGGAVYRLSSEETQSIVLDDKEENNIISFSYIMDPRGTEVEEILIDGEGSIVTTTETVTTVLEGEEAEEVLQETVEPLPVEEPVEEAELVAVEEEQVPLDNIRLEENPENVVEIQEEEVPLASMDLQKPNMAFIGATVFSAAAALVAVLWLVRKYQQTKVNYKEEE